MRSPQLFLILALALFGLSAPLIRWLVLHGGSLSGTESGAISFCNVLFIGNLCAGLVFAAWFGPRRFWREWLATGRRVRITLGGACSRPLLLFTRSLVSAVVFFWIAVLLFGFSHFGHAFSGELWLAMTLYALVVVVILGGMLLGGGAAAAQRPEVQGMERTLAAA